MYWYDLHSLISEENRLAFIYTCNDNLTKLKLSAHEYTRSSKFRRLILNALFEKLRALVPKIIQESNYE